MMVIQLYSDLLFSGETPRTPTRSNMDFSQIAITPNKYERMHRSLETRGNDGGKTSKMILTSK